MSPQCADEHRRFGAGLMRWMGAIFGLSTVLDLDAEGNACAITFEHASERTDVHHLTVEGIAA
jgi:hypothetical protein